MAHDITKDVIGCREFEVQKINISGEPAEFFGSITAGEHIVNKKYVDDQTSLHTASSTDSLTNKTIDSFTNQVEADEVHIQIRNESGSTMTKGQLVYISGYNVGLDRTLVSLTDASNTSTMPMLAMINDGNIVNNADGHATVSGRVFNIDTSAFSVGDSVYVSTTAGEMSTRPSGTTDQVQRIGIVLRSQMNNGVIQLIGAGRTNDIPNDIDHDADLINVSADDHHAQVHTIVSHDTTATGTELNTLTGGGDTTLHDHDGITENTASRHNESHTVASHSDTTGTGAELNTLTDNSMADTLHRHSKLSASDGSPDPALSVDAAGDVGIGITTPARKLEISTTSGNFQLRIGAGQNPTNTYDFGRNRTDGFFYFFGKQSGFDGYVFDGESGEKMRIIANGNVGIGTASPATSALLELSSTTGALLLTRMTTTQRNALTAVNGMLIYNTTTNKLQGYEGGGWADLI